MLRTLISTALGATVLFAPVVCDAQRQTRVDLSGPFLFAGGVAGSVTAESGPTDADDTGYGWNAGAGLGITQWLAVVGEYAIYRAADAESRRYNVEQSGAGLRLRLGGVETNGVFLLEAGGAHRRTSLPTSTAFGGGAPPGAGELVRVDGWAGWFGPGVQWYPFDDSVALEGAVAWAWGRFSHASINGERIALDEPVGITTLRLRIGLAATLF